jgi:hypothetical protein
MRFIIVELDNGDQQFFDSTYDGFRYARTKEQERIHSVEYVAIGSFLDEDDHIIYQGQDLRNMLRLLDNVPGWIRSGSE